MHLLLDKERTGNFEVYTDSKELLHSRKRGEDKCESAVSREKLFSKIEDLIRIEKSGSAK